MRLRPLVRFISRPIPDGDLGRTLGLVAPGVWVLFALYVVVFGYQAIVLGGSPMKTPLGGLALVLDFVGAALFAVPSRTPLPWWRTLTTVGIVVATVVLITWQQPFHDRAPGYVAWELGANNLLMFCLTIRGRVAAAWIAEGLSILLICTWSLTVSGSPLYGLGMSYGQPVTLLACTAFAVGLRRTAIRIGDFQRAEHERTTREARELSRDEAIESALQVIRDLAQPTLKAISDGASPSPASVRSLEAALRDQVRGRSLTIEPLVSLLQSVRDRGIEVTVLDDLGEIPVPPPELARAARWCAHLIVDTRASSFTARIAIWNGRPTVTISADGHFLNRLALRQTA
ncbi:MAG TPA: hypothetical protein VHZ81_11740 [Galbitalea sp.]|jgi:hypothetical protein|nr:hypothetical protein [Galbitalea sp.]